MLLAVVVQYICDVTNLSQNTQIFFKDIQSVPVKSFVFLIDNIGLETEEEAIAEQRRIMLFYYKACVLPN